MDGSAPPDAPTAAGPPVAGPGEAPQREPTAEWPRISDYWPDKAPSPAAADGAPPPTPAETRLIAPPPPARRPRLRLVIGLVSALVFLGVSVVVLTRLVSGPEPKPPTAAPAPQGQNDNAAPPAEPQPPVSIAPTPSAPASASPTPPAEATAAPGALPFQSGTFELVSNLGELNVSVGRPTDGVIDVRTAKGSGINARATVDGSTVRLKAEPNGRSGPARVDVLLDSRIAWKVRMSGGVANANFGLAGADVRGIDFDGGAATIDLALPRQLADIPIRMSGGVRTWRIRTEKRLPVKIDVRKGVGEVVLYGDRRKDIDRGETVRTGGRGDGRLEIEAVAGVGSLTVSSW